MLKFLDFVQLIGFIGIFIGLSVIVYLLVFIFMHYEEMQSMELDEFLDKYPQFKIFKK